MAITKDDYCNCCCGAMITACLEADIVYRESWKKNEVWLNYVIFNF